jgi:hypothetical protein
VSSIKIQVRISRMWRLRVWLALRFLSMANKVLPKNAAFAYRSNANLADPVHDDMYDGQPLH